MYHKAVFKTAFLGLVSFFLLSYSDDPPNGNTGAPFDGKCSDCHTTNNPGGYNGIASIIGLPDTVQPNTLYNLQLKASVLAGNPVRCGFQLVVVDKNNLNAGNLAALNSDADTEFLFGREYLDQRGGKFFSGALVSWNFSWTTPAMASCNTIIFYYIVNFCNGSGDFGDHSITFSDTVYLSGAAPLNGAVVNLQNNTCKEGFEGRVQALANGGLIPFTYQWSNGASSASMDALPVGSYTATIQDQTGCRVIDSTIITSLDTIPPGLTCPGSVFLCAGDTIHYPLPTISDNCALDSLVPVLWSGPSSGIVGAPGNYTVTFKAIDIQGNTSECTFEVRVNPAIQVQLDTLINDTHQGGTGSIFIRVSGGTEGNYVYTWYKDQAIFSIGMEDISGLFPGTYHVEVQDSAGCVATLDSLEVEQSSAVSMFGETAGHLGLAPNPVSNRVFWLKGLMHSPQRIALFDIQGKARHTFEIAQWPGPFHFPDALLPGVYLLMTTDAEGAIHLNKLVHQPEQ